MLIERELDSRSVYNKKFLKAIIKSYGDEVTAFYDKEILRVDYSHTSLAAISLALKKYENYYLRVFLKGWKNIEKRWLDILLMI